MSLPLIVVPVGGLCNRLRVVLSALHLHGELDRPVRIEWASEAECRAHFDDLFLPIDRARFRVTHRRWWNRPAARGNGYIPALWRTLLYGRQCTYYRPGLHGDVPALVRGGKRVYLSSCFALCDYPPALTGVLRPRPDLQARIDRLTSTFPPHIVGVHVRRTDHAVAMSRSTPEKFRRAMEEEIRRAPDVRFYLSTDDEQLKRDWLAAWPRRIITRPGAASRDTLTGMREAVVDLWGLAATRKVLGSFYSSFSGTAAEIGGIPLVTIQ